MDSPVQLSWDREVAFWCIFFAENILQISVTNLKKSYLNTIVAPRVNTIATSSCSAILAKSYTPNKCDQPEKIVSEYNCSS